MLSCRHMNKIFYAASRSAICHNFVSLSFAMETTHSKGKVMLLMMFIHGYKRMCFNWQKRQHPGPAYSFPCKYSEERVVNRSCSILLHGNHSRKSNNNENMMMKQKLERQKASTTAKYSNIA